MEDLVSGFSPKIPKYFESKLHEMYIFVFLSSQVLTMVIPKPLWKDRELFCLAFVHFPMFHMAGQVVVRELLILRFV